MANRGAEVSHQGATHRESGAPMRRKSCGDLDVEDGLDFVFRIGSGSASESKGTPITSRLGRKRCARVSSAADYEEASAEGPCEDSAQTVAVGGTAGSLSPDRRVCGAPQNNSDLQRLAGASTINW